MGDVIQFCRGDVIEIVDGWEPTAEQAEFIKGFMDYCVNSKRFDGIPIDETLEIFIGIVGGLFPDANTQVIVGRAIQQADCYGVDNGIPPAPHWIEGDGWDDPGLTWTLPTGESE